MKFNIERAVPHFQNYVATYDQQASWKDYSFRIYVADMLYGIGTSISDDYTFADGYARWLRELQSFIQQELDRMGHGA